MLQHIELKNSPPRSHRISVIVEESLDDFMQAVFVSKTKGTKVY